MSTKSIKENTASSKKLEKEVMRVHNLFWKALAKRDIDLRFSLCSDDVTFIGSGLHERAINKTEYKKINQAGVKQFPNAFKIKFLWTHLTIIKEHVACVESEVVWSQLINKKVYKELIRTTTLLKCEKNKWLVTHVHGSVPDYRLKEGDYMTNEQTIIRNKELEQQVYERTQELKKSLDELKATQVQLIHSEKMASLGELTAGIAHEIKNPLNFVNNFSELSRELLDELQEELEKNNKEEVMAIANDLKQNLEKINQHGKRADSIVKGMLLHSRGSSGEKTLTDVNDLLDQYVTLAYHGLRAKDKDFNITIEKEYDETLEKINVVSQDISRVFLNIINNACYAANEKKKKCATEFNPKLKVSTKKIDDKVEIRIGDNGNGIPADILDKIFQPFFTTKPTGEGTGLGLSLSYDAVTKVHGGELKFETKEGEGTVFIITLPNS